MYQRIKRWILPYAAPLIYFSSYNRIKKEINKCFENEYKVFCFFPAYHTGGAEKVHAQILKALQPASVACFITHKSRNDAFKETMKERSSFFIDINATGNYKYFRKKLVKYLAHKFNSLNYNCTLFGCNAVLFYELIPHINNKGIRKVDLLHAFSPYTSGIEQVSIKYVDKLDKRIVINKKTLEDYTNQYNEHHLNSEYIKRIQIIYNALENDCPVINKTFSLPFKILFVGRNSPEKRFDLYKRLASECSTKKLQVQFSVVGDFKAYTDDPIRYFGEITNEELLNKIYIEHHILITTSIYEGFPITIMEAMCKGVVNISIDVGGISEHIIPEVGVLIDNSQEELNIIRDIVLQIQNLINNIPILQNLSQNSIEYASQHFDFKSFALKYRSILLN